MNTKAMFDKAQAAKLSRPQLMAHIIWALVSQAGRSPMAVGEVAKLVASTSKIKPSAYQVKSAMNDLKDMRACVFVPGINKGRGVEMRYHAHDSAIAALACFSYGLHGSDVHEAAMEATFGLWRSARDALENIESYNKELDQSALEKGE